MDIVGRDRCGFADNIPDGHDVTHREIFSKSHQINPKSDCIYHAPIDLDPN